MGHESSLNIYFMSIDGMHHEYCRIEFLICSSANHVFGSQTKARLCRCYIRDERLNQNFFLSCFNPRGSRKALQRMPSLNRTFKGDKVFIKT